MNLALVLRQALWRIRDGVMAALLHAEKDVHRLELGPQILDLVVMVAFELLQPHFELCLRGLDVLADEGRPLLQVGANIAH